ncbi:MAG: aminopeptidase P family protein [Chloroflexota bacterium]
MTGENAAQVVESGRLKRLSALAREMKVAAVIIGPSPDLRYLTGLIKQSGDRPILLGVTPAADPVLVVPAFEAAGVGAPAELRIHGYDESTDPIRVLIDDLALLDSDGTVAVGDSLWASWLLRFQRFLPRVSFSASSPIVRELRMRKSPVEVERLREAGARVDRAFDRLRRSRFAGRTEMDVAEELDALLGDQALEPAGWGPIVASGGNSAHPHHVPSDRVIQHGDPVVLDFGGVLDGYQADITRTVHVGPPSPRFERVYRTVRAAQEAGVTACRAGVEAQQIDRATRSVITAANFGAFFIHRTGHGVGLEEHEEPYIIAGNHLRIDVGMVFSVEPGIYLPNEFGVRIEDIVAVQAGGAERLNNASREIVLVS